MSCCTIMDYNTIDTAIHQSSTCIWKFPISSQLLQLQLQFHRTFILVAAIFPQILANFLTFQLCSFVYMPAQSPPPPNEWKSVQHTLELPKLREFSTIMAGEWVEMFCDGKHVQAPPPLEYAENFYATPLMHEHHPRLHGRAILLTCIFEVEYPKMVLLPPLWTFINFAPQPYVLQNIS